MSERALTPEEIRSQTGFRLAFVMPNWQKDAACLIEFHEELDRLEKMLGSTSVIGSLVHYDGRLALGIFTDNPEIVEGSIVLNQLTGMDLQLPAATEIHD